MMIDILNAHHDGVPDTEVPAIGFPGLDQNDRAVTHVQLCAMVRDAQAQSEAESRAKPVNGGPDIGIYKLRDYCALRYGFVSEHRSFLNKPWRPPRGDPPARR
jgi:hypothetical protein